MVVALVLLLALAALLLFRERRRSDALRACARELAHIREGHSGRLRLPGPDDALEELLTQINALLEDATQESRTLHAREEELRRQIANVSHDLRTPLTSILGYLQLIRDDSPDGPEARQYLEVVRSRAGMLQELISGFYDLSRIDGGEYPLELTQVDLYREVSELLADLYDDLERCGLDVSVELDRGLPPVMADRAAVERILTNLLGNAMKHGSGTLKVALYRDGETLVTAFTNDAPDLTQEDLSRVFDRFYTADQMRTGQNTGLGLAIVKGLADQMGHQAFATLENGQFTAGVRWSLRPSSLPRA